jgi:hypothetical protein
MCKFRRNFQLGFDFDLGAGVLFTRGLRAQYVLELSSTVCVGVVFLLDTRG